MEFKEQFIKRYSELTDFKKFKEYCKKPLRKSLRVNTLKTTVNNVMKNMKGLKQVPWCKEGFWVKGIGLGNLEEHFLGYIYLQEAVSMIPVEVLRPKENEKVLDMCASPGSKTTQMAAKMKNKGVIVANDNKIDRMRPLVMNLTRCGVSNAVVTRMEGGFFKQKFDKILVDAPCSGTGTIRKSYKNVRMYGFNHVKRFSGIQKQLLRTAFECLKENGILVYSTCTLEPEENEGVVNHLLEKNNNAVIEEIKLDIKRSNAILEFEDNIYNKEIRKCLRIWPQDNDTEGFFVARIRKV